MLTERQFPYTGPYGLATGPFKSKGPTAEALKRFFGRLGYIDWNDYDQHYNLILGNAMKKYKKKKGLPEDPSYGKIVWPFLRNERVPKGRPNAGEYCLDRYARTIVQNEAKVTADSDEEERVMYFIREYWLAAIANNPNYDYTQTRPINVAMSPSSATAKGDCSGTIINAVYYAGKKAGVTVNDPAKWNFTGYGNTDYHEDDWPRVFSPFRIGDIAHFHSSRHVIQCIKVGTTETAQWGSHGWNGSPELIGSLQSYSRFPEEFMFVVRPELIKEAA